jgi:hypothetical protein
MSIRGERSAGELQLDQVEQVEVLENVCRGRPGVFRPQAKRGDGVAGAEHAVAVQGLTKFGQDYVRRDAIQSEAHDQHLPASGMNRTKPEGGAEA